MSIKRFTRGATRIAFVGLDQAGKTCLLKRLMEPSKPLNLEEPPTLGHETTVLFLPMSPGRALESQESRHRFIVYDLGGQAKFRRQWAEKIKQARLVIFVVDCSDHDRFKEARMEFERHVLPALSSHSLLFVATKQDLSNAMSAEEILPHVLTDEVRNKFKISTVDASAKTGLGLDLIETWLLARMKGSSKQ